MNIVILKGNLARDITMSEVKTGSGETLPKATTVIAVKKGHSKSAESVSHFIPLTAFGNRATFLEKYFHKGSPILIKGELAPWSYKDEDGNWKSGFSVDVAEVEFCEGKGGESKSQSNDSPDAAPEGFSALDEDIPFR